MTKVRRDTKGRILHPGESMRSDGRYAFKYVGADGRVKMIYSWRLTAADPTPKGKRANIPLRDQEKQILRDKEDGIIPRKITVCSLFEKYITLNMNVKPKTVENRKALMRILENDEIGSMFIDQVKPSDTKIWALRMHDKGYSYQSIDGYRRSLKASFRSAIQDDLIRKNPFEFALKTVLPNDTEPKTALTRKQENLLLEFMANDPVYRKSLDEVIILLNTGLRISEFCGLTFSDIDFEKHIINVDHQLLWTTERGYFITAPKTRNGIRQVPLNDKALNALKNVVDHRDRSIDSREVDGYSGFLFCTKTGRTKLAVDFDQLFRRIKEKYNKVHEEKLPQLTPHILRHTFCSRCATARMNPKILQKIMGHGNINMTWDYYTHVSSDDVTAEMDKIAL